ncbi:hypothetical protein J8281_15410 [Aquimarina sp. U1-2]|uniref:hypothetical protein n=1 Tax=Aquimarina sp. U1-2 TaxID=2823141 RepID=UPI001AECF5CA|nr:hypothetical protein [Aquimarina sp. U1-2]MBP2833582.1 hypothetical protein [Aquimarina sp. U1-2]
MKAKGNVLGFFGRSLSIILIVFFPFVSSYAQCTPDPATIDIEVCSMETLDFDGDTNPDGIISMYDETSTTSVDGTWTIAPEYAAAFDSSTGRLSTWGLQNSTVTATENEYFFELRNASCGDVVLKTARV